MYRLALVYGASPENVGRWRVEAAATKLYHEGRAGILAVTGRSEWDKLAQIATKEFNVKESDIRWEKESRTTGENIFYIRERVLPQLEKEFGPCEQLYSSSQIWHIDPRILFLVRKLLPRMPHDYVTASDGRLDRDIAKSIEEERHSMSGERIIFNPIFYPISYRRPDIFYGLILRLTQPERA